MTQRIEIKNLSSIPSDELARILVAVAAQANEDVAPIWDSGQVALVTIASTDEWSADAWRFVVADTPAQVSETDTSDLGFHDRLDGAPIGYAFVEPTRKAGFQPSVTISHEILEMIGDPLIDQWCQWSDIPNPLFLGQELCDPVEDDSFGYKSPKNGVLLSNFVTPAYFVPGSRGPWDFRGNLTGPNALTAGGYQLTWDPQNGAKQDWGRTRGGRASETFSTSFSRRRRRVIKAQQRSQVARALVDRAGRAPSPTPKGAWSGLAFGPGAALTILFIGLLVACGVWISQAAVAHSAAYIRTQWLAVEATLIGLCVVAGFLVNKRSDGILIDEENRISLGRLQWVAWLVVLLGGFFTEAIWNVAIGWNSAKGSFPDMQADLYSLLGIVSGSAVTGSLIINSKKQTSDPNTAFPEEKPLVGAPAHMGSVDCNVSPAEAGWEDLYLGEEVANAGVVDISRLQKLVITVLLIMAYVQMLWDKLGADLSKDGHFEQMPQVTDSFLWLLGISHAAYLAYKALPKNASVATPTATRAGPEAVL